MIQNIKGQNYLKLRRISSMRSVSHAYTYSDFYKKKAQRYPQPHSTCVKCCNISQHATRGRKHPRTSPWKNQSIVRYSTRKKKKKTERNIVEEEEGRVGGRGGRMKLIIKNLHLQCSGKKREKRKKVQQIGTSK